MWSQPDTAVEPLYCRLQVRLMMRLMGYGNYLNDVNCELPSGPIERCPNMMVDEYRGAQGCKLKLKG